MQHDDLPFWLALKIKFEGLHASNTPCRSSTIRPRDQEADESEPGPSTSEHGTYVLGESSSGQDNKSEPGDEHQYHIDLMQNFLKNDIVWESRKEILVSPFPKKPTPII
ncbi:hypothetical protein Tco_0177564 [Tanacetum coccineum]